MTYLPISLGVGRRPNAGGAVQKDRVPSKDEIEKTLWRDAFTCRCCGFQSKKFQRVIPAEPVSAHEETGIDALITVCSFCELCFTLDRAGLTGAGLLVWLPEISQSELHHVMRAIYLARLGEGPLADAATRTIEVLIARRTEAKKRLGTDDPLLLATALHEAIDDATYAGRMAKLEGIRLLPLDRYLVRQRSGSDTNIFPYMLDYWRSSEGPFAKLPTSEWTGMFEQLSKRVSA